MCGHRLIAFLILVGLPQMVEAIKFDHDSRCMTIEVRNKTIDDLLAPKVQAKQSIPAHPLPHSPLLRCLIPAQLLRPLRLHARDFLAPDDSTPWQ